MFDKDSCYILTNSKEKVVISKSQLECYSIENNMLLTANCVKNDDGTFEALNFVNLEPIKNIGTFEELEIRNKTQKISLNSPIFEEFNSIYSLKQGQCVYVQYSYNCAPEEVLNRIAQENKNYNIELYGVLSNEFENSKTNSVYICFNSFSVFCDVTERINHLKNVIEDIKSKILNGKNCALFLGNLELILESFKQLYILNGSSELIANISAIEELNKIFALSRQTNKGALTIYALSSNKTPSQFKPYFNALINFERNENLIVSKESYSIY